jgi:hypothetical protein
MTRSVPKLLTIALLVSCSQAPVPSAGEPKPKAAPAPRVDFTTVFTIVLENQDYADIISQAGKKNAPYINSLAEQYGLATNYHDSGSHPSLPNYLYMVSGSTHNVRADVNPDHFLLPLDRDNLGHQFETAKPSIAWRSYQEDMGTPCLLDVHGLYAPKHDPFLYFKNIQGDKQLCSRTNVDFSQFPKDLAAGTYRYMWITPHLIHDGHNPTSDPVTGLKHANAWCEAEIPKILASAVYKAGGVIFLTWDEAEGRHGNSKSQIPMIIISPKLKQKQSTQRFSHASYLATVEEIFGLQKLGDANKAASLIPAFFE